MIRERLENICFNKHRSARVATAARKVIFASCTVVSFMLTGCNSDEASGAVVLRVSNWEEYIDEGDWDETIELEDGTEICGENSIITDFENWYYETYGKKVKVEYSTFGTNEELYNQITIGDVYDLVCPSDYMMEKLLREGKLVPYSKSFFDASGDNNYYAKGVSPYIDSVFKGLSVNGEDLSGYAAGYMWGTMGVVYNPEEISKEDASHWDVILNKDYYRRITVKDSVRDTYFAALGIEYYDEITADDFKNSPDYRQKLSKVLNRTDEASVKRAEDILSKAKDNVYSFETDSGKADMVTGKVVANIQWSGDAVYTLDQAEEDGVELCYVMPDEGTNLWFDGWVMLKEGLEQDPDKQQAAEAFVNYMSRPDNAIRNMYYIGYTSVISGGESDLIYQYINYCYAADTDEAEEPEDIEGIEAAADGHPDDTDDEDTEPGSDETLSEEENGNAGEETVVYSGIGYFFEADTDEADEKYSVITTPDQLERQLYAQYPSKSIVDHAVVMECFDEEANERINRAWTNVRCFDINKLFVWK